MKTCEKCGKVFPIRTRIGDRLHNLNNRRYCIECSPFGEHNTRPLTRAKRGETKICTACSQEKPLDEFYKKGKYPHPECRQCFNKRSQERNRKNKLKAVEYKGGRCQRCGYDKSAAALDFHHLDRAGKTSNISEIKKRSFGRIVPELDKCILLCANCHRELEALGDKADWSFIK